MYFDFFPKDQLREIWIELYPFWALVLTNIREPQSLIGHVPLVDTKCPWRGELRPGFWVDLGNSFVTKYDH